MLVFLASMRSEDPKSVLSYRALAMELLLSALAVYALGLIGWKCRQSVKEKMAEMITPVYLLTLGFVMILINSGVLFDGVYSEMRKE